METPFLLAVFLSTLTFASPRQSFAQSDDVADVVDEDLAGSGVAEKETAIDFVRPDGRQPDNQSSIYSDRVQMRNPHMGGSGCQSGTVDAALSPDKKTLSVLFSDYLAESGGATGLSHSMKTCEISIPFDVPEGMQVSVVQMDYRGFVSIPQNGLGSLAAQYALSDESSGRRYARRFRQGYTFPGPLEENFTVSGRIDQPASRLWSHCGKSFKLHMNTRLAAVSNQQMDEALAILDSLDVGAADRQVKYHLLWRRCRLANGAGRPGLGPNPNPNPSPRPRLRLRPQAQPRPRVRPGVPRPGSVRPLPPRPGMRSPLPSRPGLPIRPLSARGGRR